WLAGHHVIPGTCDFRGALKPADGRIPRDGDVATRKVGIEMRGLSDGGHNRRHAQSECQVCAQKAVLMDLDGEDVFTLDQSASSKFAELGYREADRAVGERRVRNRAVRQAQPKELRSVQIEGCSVVDGGLDAQHGMRGVTIEIEAGPEISSRDLRGARGVGERTKARSDKLVGAGQSAVEPAMRLRSVCRGAEDVQRRRPVAPSRVIKG